MTDEETSPGRMAKAPACGVQKSRPHVRFGGVRQVIGHPADAWTAVYQGHDGIATQMGLQPMATLLTDMRIIRRTAQAMSFRLVPSRFTRPPNGHASFIHHHTIPPAYLHYLSIYLGFYFWFLVFNYSLLMVLGFVTRTMQKEIIRRIR